jgi:hypothetical protein
MHGASRDVHRKRWSWLQCCGCLVIQVPGRATIFALSNSPMLRLRLVLPHPVSLNKLFFFFAVLRGWKISWCSISALFCFVYRFGDILELPMMHCGEPS